MKTVNRALILMTFLIGLSACSADPPRVRVQNQRQEIVDVALKPPSGSTININDVGPGAATGYIDVPTSQYEVDANVENVSPHATTHFTADEDQTYTVVILNTSPPTVTVGKP